ncbi:hypothetical protein [Flavobacterium crassostreae]|uniref:Chromosome partitioning protein ParA n=1 Tax=Flavobacterium crassostreae TaxID=1763534 RepID=A0A1B9DYU8_9FLAO|nr:hypothetical protein [Flavobacterium crassostreae]OCB74859.1 hypothetical protein LPBF_09620 [Flavobacterium crassostreae]
MKNLQNNSILKAVIAILFVAGLAYAYKANADLNVVKTALKAEATKKELALKELLELKATYDVAIAENTSLSEELMQERDKVVSLLAALSTCEGGDVGSMLKYKKQFYVLQNKMKVLIAEKERLKNENALVTSQRDSTTVVLEESKITNKLLSSHNKALINTVEKGSKILLLNLKVAAFKVKSSGKQIPTDKANRTDILKISFTIAENQIAKATEKTYYIQVVDSENNIVGNKKTANFGTASLEYSLVTKVRYANQTIQVHEELPSMHFIKGDYKIAVFDARELVLDSSFILR